MEKWAELRTWRPVVMGRRGVVASNHPLATEAGLAILRRGGNAADAYLAAASTLAVVEPFMSGVGGDGFALVFQASTGEARVINASGCSPMTATTDRFPGGLPERGPLTATVPGLVDGWCEIHRRYGSMPLPALLESAIYHAREGFGATRTFVRHTREAVGALAADPAAAAVFLPGGSVPALGATIRQAALARTLESLAAGGRDAFYEGDIARDLSAWMRERGGLLSADDLRKCRSDLQTPLRTTYRGLEVLEAPPNSTGFVLLQELNVAEQFDLAAMGSTEGSTPLSADLIHTLVEIKKLCFLDRERIGGDPEEALPVLEQILSKEYAAGLASQVNPQRAFPRPVGGAPAADSDTTYLAVADGEGNAISALQSLNQVYGAAVIAGETGILMNNRMRYWHLEPGHPNRLAPGKRVRHTMNPPMVLRDGRPYLVFGTPGSEAQVQVNLQVATAVLDFGLDPQQAVEMARWRSMQPGTDANWPHEAPDQLLIEDRVSMPVLEDLRDRGHQVTKVGPLEGPCSVNLLRYDPESGFWQAGSDPRRDACALAF